MGSQLCLFKFRDIFQGTLSYSLGNLVSPKGLSFGFLELQQN